MSHDHTDHAHGEVPAQGLFVGWLALGLIAFAVIFVLVLLIAGATHPTA